MRVLFVIRIDRPNSLFKSMSKYMLKINDVYWGGLENPRRWINNRGFRGNDHSDVGVVNDLVQAVGYLIRRNIKRNARLITI